MLKGKTVLLGVTGSIAAYKIANLASMLVKMHCDVHVIMTKKLFLYLVLNTARLKKLAYVGKELALMLKVYTV